jgi:uncharacterized protein (TIGR02246 family)
LTEATAPSPFADLAARLFERRRAAWLAEDVDAYLDLFAGNVTLEIPGRVIEGRAAYERLVRASFARARPVEFVFHTIATAPPDVVMADWTITVERRDSGAPVRWRGMSVCRIAGGRIAWWREYYDDPAALARSMTDRNARSDGIR